MKYEITPNDEDQVFDIRVSFPCGDHRGAEASTRHRANTDEVREMFRKMLMTGTKTVTIISDQTILPAGAAHHWFAETQYPYELETLREEPASRKQRRRKRKRRQQNRAALAGRPPLFQSPGDSNAWQCAHCKRVCTASLDAGPVCVDAKEHVWIEMIAGREAGQP